ncbi:trihelix transcription factor GT-2 [Pistacia vera]|uniref:trihelix transcription factor GT-2 n=1 Tax=Pistacia vera TaxID=55513 RepID=UPI0012633897|nr:trihelix transcription factor GT-2 [Pistacia vera]
MLGDPSVSGDVATITNTTTGTGTAAATATREDSHEAANNIVGSNSGEEDKSRVNLLDESDRSFGGNRWPRQETVALLKIRSDMDVAFRDASVKGPLWEEVSRKLAELGYNRSAKKCKEKFENVFKYHKRTKDGRTSKSQGKTYRFFDQLEAFEHHQAPSLPSPTPPPPQPPKSQPVPAVAAAFSASMPASHNITITSTVPSTTTTNIAQNIVTIPATSLAIPSFPSTNLPSVQVTNPVNYSSFQNISADLLSNSTSSSTSSDLEFGARRKRKRKWRDFFGRLMKEVVNKQEELQKKFLEAIEKREHERMVREEAWRMQEMTRINREREILAQERSIAAAKDAAVMAFLQKLSDQQNPIAGQVQNINIPPVIQISQPLMAAAPPPAAVPAPPQLVSLSPALQPLPSATSGPLAQAPTRQVLNLEMSNGSNGDQNSMAISSSRWPKVEVQALISLRTNLDSKYQENGPKGPLWEEISAGMRKLGYNRSAKRCKEKWENINKYFKKVKESNKKRPEDSKTCPYFEQLDALYKEKNKFDSSSKQIKPENTVPLMVRPEQQWPPQPDQLRHQDSAMDDIESDQNGEEDDKDMGDDDEEDDGGGFEIVPNRQVSAVDAAES